MTWDEWNRISGDAAARRDGGTRLNSAGPDAADLKTTGRGKRDAVNALSQRIRPGLDKAGVRADENTDAAEREFKEWQTGSGLKDAHAKWALQVKSLQARLARDQAALGLTRRDFQYIDHGVRSALARIDSPAPDPRRDV
ncbi:hypothetical protein AB0G74_29755 [Streptomyces sp. NPDC020875]|uniref:hypothetical protein n=1 Tax=Streptomyces sp. NPDC020875 TaxID=3154898 RepID=UPI003402978D